MFHLGRAVFDRYLPFCRKVLETAEEFKSYLEAGWFQKPTLLGCTSFLFGELSKVRFVDFSEVGLLTTKVFNQFSIFNLAIFWVQARTHCPRRYRTRSLRTRVGPKRTRRCESFLQFLQFLISLVSISVWLTLLAI